MPFAGISSGREALSWQAQVTKPAAEAGSHRPIRNVETARRPGGDRQQTGAPRTSNMSRAFVKEADEALEEFPERPVSPHPNFVTAEGLALLDATLARLHQEHAAAQAASDRAALARLARDLRYWTSRRATAQLISAASSPSAVQFGCTVSILREDGRRQTYRIVGEDEADPSHGTISYVSPVARALTGRKVGDVVRAGTSDAEVIEVKS